MAMFATLLCALSAALFVQAQNPSSYPVTECCQLGDFIADAMYSNIFYRCENADNFGNLKASKMSCANGARSDEGFVSGPSYTKYPICGVIDKACTADYPGQCYRRASGFTSWVNFESPKYGSRGDNELLHDAQRMCNLAFPGSEVSPIIECREAKTQIPWWATGQKLAVACEPRKGLLCLNSDNYEGCKDYEVRVFCSQPTHSYYTCNARSLDYRAYDNYKTSPAYDTKLDETPYYGNLYLNMAFKYGTRKAPAPGPVGYY
ncbi:uncharacterized protein LOC106171829 [Lingula anatina]|uniref:Uncharacterized protein LOC106171829 n=1 Tax=Lingula anatina TaxID=7574 RepID=A0A1S3JBQ9_LINAN|nr:uncharacterized protein LOC106171829 [Lingula anatina]|eukprot:XP_013407758.1 uncharacterized protein LOC106171829 [Lingula anatina]